MRYLWHVSQFILILWEVPKLTSSSFIQWGSSRLQGGTCLSCCATILRPDLDRTNLLDGVGNIAAEVWFQEERDIDKFQNSINKETKKTPSWETGLSRASKERKFHFYLLIAVARRILLPELALLRDDMIHFGWQLGSQTVAVGDHLGWTNKTQKVKYLIGTET